MQRSNSNVSLPKSTTTPLLGRVRTRNSSTQISNTPVTIVRLESSSSLPTTNTFNHSAAHPESPSNLFSANAGKKRKREEIEIDANLDLDLDEEEMTQTNQSRISLTKKNNATSSSSANANNSSFRTFDPDRLTNMLSTLEQRLTISNYANKVKSLSTLVNSMSKDRDLALRHLRRLDTGFLFAAKTIQSFSTEEREQFRASQINLPTPITQRDIQYRTAEPFQFQSLISARELPSKRLTQSRSEKLAQIKLAILRNRILNDNELSQIMSGLNQRQIMDLLRPLYLSTKNLSTLHLHNNSHSINSTSPKPLSKLFSLFYNPNPEKFTQLRQLLSFLSEKSNVAQLNTLCESLCLHAIIDLALDTKENLIINLNTLIENKDKLNEIISLSENIQNLPKNYFWTLLIHRSHPLNEVIDVVHQIFAGNIIEKMLKFGFISGTNDSKLNFNTNKRLSDQINTLIEEFNLFLLLSGEKNYEENSLDIIETETTNNNRAEDIEGEANPFEIFQSAAELLGYEEEKK